LRASFVWALLLFSCAAAIAQDETAPIQVGSVTFSGSVRERYEAWDWFEPAKGQNQYQFSGTLIRLALSQNRETFDWKIEFAVPVLLGLPDQAVQPAPAGQLGLGASYYAANDKNQNTAFIFPKQAYVRLKGGASTLQVGRFEFMDGSEIKPKDPTLVTLKNERIGQRLIGTFGYSDVMRSFDGLHYAYSGGSWNFTAVSAIPTRGVFQVDGWGWVKTPVTYAAVTHEINHGEDQPNAEWRVFGIYYNDDRGLVKTDNQPASVRAGNLQAINIGTYGAHFISALPTSAGTFDVLGWVATQNGSWGQQTQRASAFAGEAGYQPALWENVRPWIRTGYFISTGDGNPNDNVHSTFFAILPTPRVYARFPFFNEMNNRDLFEEVMLRPGKSLVIRSDIHGLWLSNSHDLWYTGGGAFQPWTFGFQGRPSNGHTNLATLYDISGDYNWKHGISTTLYFGYAVGGAVIKAIYPKDSNGALSYVEFNYHF
jgi:Alginate export